jgi:hypothetical protein
MLSTSAIEFAGTRTPHERLFPRPLEEKAWGTGVMPSDIDDEERWRTLAREARALADEMTDPEARQLMLQVAAGYELLAQHARAREDRKDSTGRH